MRDQTRTKIITKDSKCWGSKIGPNDLWYPDLENEGIFTKETIVKKTYPWFSGSKEKLLAVLVQTAHIKNISLISNEEIVWVKPKSIQKW